MELINYDFHIINNKDYSKLITLSKLNKLYSKHRAFIRILYIYNKYRFIKSYAYITIISAIDTERYFHYNNIDDLQSLYNVTKCILLPIPVKVNNSNIFLITYDYKQLSQIVFIKNHYIFYTDLLFENNVFVNPHHQNISNTIYEAILQTRSISSDIIDSKQLLDNLQ